MEIIRQLRAAAPSPKTYIVFITAYDQYAIDAFGRGAVDYLLKSVTADRLAATEIVNMQAVATITRDDSGRGTLRLKNRPETLPVSLSFMPLFRNM